MTTQRPMGAGMEMAAGRLAAAGMAVSFAGLMVSCSVNVPDPAATTPSPSESVLATPTITPGHDAEAVAAKDMPFSSGGTLAAGKPVGLSEGLKEAPGWTLVAGGAQGESRYAKADGCVVVTRVSLNQEPLAVPGDDKASTEALFRYLDPGILPGNLKTAALKWGAEPDKPARSAEVLVLESSPQAKGKSIAVMARLFARAGSSVYLSVSCPDAATLAAARAEAQSRLALVPPSS